MNIALGTSHRCSATGEENKARSSPAVPLTATGEENKARSSPAVPLTASRGRKQTARTTLIFLPRERSERWEVLSAERAKRRGLSPHSGERSQRVASADRGGSPRSGEENRTTPSAARTAPPAVRAGGKSGNPNPRSAAAVHRGFPSSGRDRHRQSSSARSHISRGGQAPRPGFRRTGTSRRAHHAAEEL